MNKVTHIHYLNQHSSNYPSVLIDRLGNDAPEKVAYLPALYGRQALIRHLERHGCVLLREGAKHRRYINLANTNRSATIPRHTEIADLLAIKICRQMEYLTQNKYDSTVLHLPYR